MATSAISSYNLDSSYVSMIREIMSMERQPLDRLTKQQFDDGPKSDLYRSERDVNQFSKFS